MAEAPFDGTLEADVQLGRSSVGPYRVTGVLGSGGMGVVYRALGPEGAPAAVKTLLHAMPRADELHRFDREASVQLSHPNVVEVLGQGVDADGTRYIAFELLNGESLDARLARGPLPWEEAVDVGVQLCAGLSAVHALGVVHRDIKPANVFVCEDGTVKLLDFGIARTALAARVTRTGVMVGTASYVSPEQARGERDVDARADVWSLGVLLYRAVSGVLPFGGDTALAAVLAILTDTPTPLARVAPAAPPAFARVVDRCLARDPQERWPSAASLSEALLAVDHAELDGSPAPASRPPPAPVITAGESRVVTVMAATGVTDVEAVEASVRGHGGQPVRLEPTTVLGLFGGTQWDGDEVARAVSCALECEARARRIAIGSGRASQDRHGLAGDALPTAERAALVAEDGVILDGALARRLDDRFLLEPVDRKRFRVLRARPPSWPAPPTDAAPSMLGRKAQLGQIAATLDRVAEEQRPVVLFVSGPPGIGKSTLAREAQRSLLFAQPARFRLLCARGESLTRERPLAVLGSALAARAGRGAAEDGWPRIDDEAPEEERRRAVERLVAEAALPPSDAADCVEMMCELLGVPMPASTAILAARADARLMADRMELAIEAYLEGLSAQGPLCLLIEDLHLADASSVQLLGRVLDTLDDRALAVMALARTSLVEAAGGVPWACDTVHVQLRGLPLEEVEELACSVAGRALPGPLVAALHERTQGSPLFVEEIVLSMRARGDLDRPLDELPLPLTVEAAVQARLDLLPSEEKDLVKRASLLGRAFGPDEMEGLGIEDAARTLESLRRRDVLAAASGRGVRRGRAYSFRSSITGDVAYEMIARELRESWHREVAAFLRGRADADAEEVATHFERGGEVEPATEAYARAALEAARRGDSEGTVRCSDRALALGAPLPSPFELWMARADALRFLGRREEQRRALAQAIEHAATGDEHARAFVEEAARLTRAGQLDEAREVSDRAVELARGSATAGSLLLLALVKRAEVSIMQSALDDAAAVLEEAESVLERAGPAERARLSSAKALLATSRGDVGAARDAYAGMVALCRELGDVRRGAAHEQNLADALNRVGAYAEAEAALREALAGCRRVRNRMVEGWALANLGHALYMQDRAEEALETLAGAATLAEVTGDARLEVAVGIYLTRALRVASRPDAGPAESAAEQAGRLGLRGLRAMALAAASDAWIALGDPPRALARSREAMALRDELGGLEEDEGEALLAHVQALSRSGHAEEAIAARSSARARLRELAARIQDVDLRGRFLRDVPAHRALLEGAP